MRYHSRASSRRGFTLVELLTAMTVLSLLALLMVQIVSISIQSTNVSLHKADAVGQIRQVLDRFGNDWDNRLRRADAPFTVTKNTGDDTVSFYSAVNGFGGASIRPQLSQVDYVEVQRTPTIQPYLSRGVLNTSWTSATPLQLGFGTALPLISAQSSGSAADYQSLSDDVCRFEVCFILKSTGKIVAAQPANFQDVGAVVISIAALDRASRAKLSSTQIGTLTSFLTDAVDGNTATPADTWINALPGSGLTPIIQQNVRIYQRTYYVR